MTYESYLGFLRTYCVMVKAHFGEFAEKVTPTEPHNLLVKEGWIPPLFFSPNTTGGKNGG